MRMVSGVVEVLGVEEADDHLVGSLLRRVLDGEGAGEHVVRAEERDRRQIRRIPHHAQLPAGKRERTAPDSSNLGERLADGHPAIEYGTDV